MIHCRVYVYTFHLFISSIYFDCARQTYLETHDNQGVSLQAWSIEGRKSWWWHNPFYENCWILFLLSASPPRCFSLDERSYNTLFRRKAHYPSFVQYSSYVWFLRTTSWTLWELFTTHHEPHRRPRHRRHQQHHQHHQSSTWRWWERRCPQLLCACPWCLQPRPQRWSPSRTDRPP